MSAGRFPLMHRLKEAGLHLAAAAASLRRRLPEEQGLETLTPVRLDATQSERYEREMVLAMTDPHVRNIAITGGYGAGKSSLIRTFKENHRGFTYASVSLATFRKEGIITESADEVDDWPRAVGHANRPTLSDGKVGTLVERIEETIVQQLLYAVPATKLPRTRLKRIMQPSRGRALVATLMLSLAILAGSRLYLITAFPPRTLEIDWLTTKFTWLPVFWAFTIVCAVAACALYQVVRSLSLLNIDGWSIKGGAIESMQHSSVLHKNVDEIIYCFQNSRIDVVVIEDLDRFGIQDVFFRLREINAIINESPKIKRTVRFIYALNDELFAGSEKTKFFDVVLPVVPVINKENSHAKMIDLLKKRSLGGKTFAEGIDDELVETVSYRIDDMRLVKNIVNELDVFARILAKDLPLVWNKLFALIVVKNLHSDQYWQLSKRTGFLYSLISGYTPWRNLRAEGIRTELAELEQVLARKQKDVARTRSELRASVWYQAQLHAGASIATHLYRGSTPYTFIEFLEDDTFAELASSTSTVQFVGNGSRIGQTFLVSAILTGMDYDARYLAIEADDPEVRSRLAVKHDELRDLHKLPLSEALLKGYQREYADDLTAHETIRYLLVAGHLDEDYGDYLGHFYGHAIGREDMELVFALRRGEECDVAAAIKEPEKFLKKLRTRNMDHGRGIISELLFYLAHSYRVAPQAPHVDDLRRILDDAPAHLPRFLDALDILIERQEEAVVLQAIYGLRSTLFAFVLAGHGPSPDAPKPSHIVAMLNALDLDQLKRLDNADSSIKERIEALTDASALVVHLSPSSDGWQWLTEAEVRFDRLITSTPPEVLSALVEADALSPSLSMLRLVALNGEPLATPAPPVTVSRLLAADRITGTGAFIGRHINAVVTALLSQAVKLDETADSVLMALKAINDDDDLAQRYFVTTLCLFPTLEMLESRFWDSAMRGDRIEDRVGALRSYEALRPRTGTEAAEEVDERTIRVILKNYVSLHSDQLGQALWTDAEADERLQEWIATDPDLDDETILALLSKTVITNPALLTEATSDERLQLLARYGHLGLSEAIWVVIAERALATQVAYLEPQWNQVRLTPIEPRLDFELVAHLYRDGVLSIDDALRIFAAMDGTLLDGEQAIVGTLAERADNAGLAFPAPLVHVAARLVQSGGDDTRWTRSLLAQAMPVMTWPAVSAALRTLGGDLAKLAEGKSVEVAPGDGVDQVLNALKARGFASSLGEGKKGTKVNMRKKLT